jgi:hypothetical protein
MTENPDLKNLFSIKSFFEPMGVNKRKNLYCHSREGGNDDSYACFL